MFERIKVADTSGDVKLVGDIDDDGALDLVLGGFPSDPLSWWRWPDLHRTTIAVPRMEFTTHGALVDVDGDGDLDIVTGDGSDGPNLVWFENPSPHGDPADGTQWKRHEIGVAGSWVKDVAALDFDNDGRIDIAVRTPGGLMIFFQDGPGIWQRVVMKGFNLGEEGMASGDVDGDGNVDLVLCGEWARSPGGAAARNPARWKAYGIGAFSPAFKALVIDVDGDGRADVLTSSSEHTADIAWFRADGGPTGRWTRYVIQPAVSGAHTLQAADMDGDGDIDVVVGQMHTTEEKALTIHYNLNGHGTQWARQVVDDTGLHNGIVADIDRDGDFDIFGSNWAGNPPLYVWINRLDPRAPRRRLDQWTYRRITNDHVRSFGLAFADVDGDRRTDIVSGPFWYRQPPRTWNDAWEQIELGEALDAVAALDLDGDGRAEIIAQRGGDGPLRFTWLKATDAGARTFQEYAIGEVPGASHALGAQGHVLASIVPGPRPQLAFSSGGGVFYFEVPDKPASAPWRRTRISAETSDEGIAFADIDGDGRADLIATIGATKEVAWWRNPGTGAPDWERHVVGALRDAVYLDRVAAADLDGDGRVDIVVTEENGKAEGASAHWFRQPAKPGGAWNVRTVTTRGSLNSLTAADMDGDGDTDFVLAEHRGPLRMSIWNNLGAGRFVEQIVDAGKESHLGARVVDLDGDGLLDIVSIAWDAPKAIHVWRNGAVSDPPSRSASRPSHR